MSLRTPAVRLRLTPRPIAHLSQRSFSRPLLAAKPHTRSVGHLSLRPINDDDEQHTPHERQLPEHAVISTFDLFSIGVGPSSSHTVGPMRAAKIFITDLKELDLLDKVHTVKINLYGSLAATGALHFRCSVPDCLRVPKSQAKVIIHPKRFSWGSKVIQPLCSDPETIDTGTIPSRYDGILENKHLMLGGHHRISYDMDRDMLWRWDQVLKTHPNGMRFSCFDKEGDLLATNEYFSVGGGFVVNEKTKVDENLFYKGVDKTKVHGARLHQIHSLSDPVEQHALPGETSEEGASAAEPEYNEPPYPFDTGTTLLALTKKHNMTIAQIVHDNEKSFGYTDEDIHEKLMRIWQVMDECIRTGVSTSERTLPGRLGLRRRAPMLYRRLMRGFYPGVAAPERQAIGAGNWASEVITGPEEENGNGNPSRNGNGNGEGKKNGKVRVVSSPTSARAPRVTGSFDHAILPMPPRRTVIPAMDFLSCYAIAVNEVNASGGRIVTSPTNGAAGVIPAVLKYIIEFVSDDPEKSIQTFLLTAAAVGMLFKRGSTISAAEGGCQAEVGVACSMASAGFAACMGASPETVLQAAEIGIEHNLGLTCDPIDGLVQVPCIERNSLGAVKAVTAAQLSMASDGVYSVTLDEAIEAMRLTAADMSVKYKETSLSGLACAAAMAPVQALDHFYLVFTLLVTVGYQLSGFAIAWTLQFDKITDFTGGSNFFLLALLTLLCGNTFHARNVIASVLVMVWAVRIAGFLLFRVLKMGSDTRFDDIRTHFLKFLGFWIGQILWIWTVSLPLTILNSPAVSDLQTGGSNPAFGTSRDIAGIVLWTLGGAFGRGLAIHHTSESKRRSSAPVMIVLLISVIRIMCWWGIWILCLSPTTNGDLPASSRSAQYGAIVSPIFTLVLLMFGSGIPTAEKPTAKKFFLMSEGSHANNEHSDVWTQYKAYLSNTSILIPIPPLLYRPLPSLLKKTFLLDFPMYQFDEATDGAAALREMER
ncbi:hypothetical protein NLJ89_g7224 [Agrocybe chaxingu]|uniref:L-serine ammonia-lyase n=1 Tax=Agrocybe chaxingu TaxID=84603 RepID=A0A9W8MRY8_9AGAR|nr:hypothetical protein NLJ89_g7224 [Agrocybe chaxingu]